MAYSKCDSSALRDAILRVWRPATGARSLFDVITRNVQKVYASHGLNTFHARAMALDNIPFRHYFPNKQEYSDNQPPFQIGEEIVSGSWSEGLFLYAPSANIKFPDMDFLLVLTHITFSQDDQRFDNLTLKEDTPFLHAYVRDEDAIKMWSEFLVDDKQGKRLSAWKLKKRLRENYTKSPFIPEDDVSNDIDDGAAVYINRNDLATPSLKATTTLFNNIISSHLNSLIDLTKRLTSFTGCDIVLAISCEGWPSCAQEWITRYRTWPSDDIVKKIIHEGFHIVPKQSIDGDFRLSFSCTETTLIENLSDLQHKVLRSFKAVVKYYQHTWSPRIKEIITTYHLKTISFWYFERNMQDSFTEKTVVTHLILLLQELANSLRKQELPMYFMPKVNLLKSIDSPEELIVIAEKIDQLSHEFTDMTVAVESIVTAGIPPDFGFDIMAGKWEENKGNPVSHTTHAPQNTKIPQAYSNIISMYPRISAILQQIIDNSARESESIDLD